MVTEDESRMTTMWTGFAWSVGIIGGGVMLVGAYLMLRAALFSGRCLLIDPGSASPDETRLMWWSFLEGMTCNLVGSVFLWAARAIPPTVRFLAAKRPAG